RTASSDIIRLSRRSGKGSLWSKLRISEARARRSEIGATSSSRLVATKDGFSTPSSRTALDPSRPFQRSGVERSCELGLWRLTADKIGAIFGTRVNRRMRGKLATIIDRVEHGHHVFRAYFKHAFLKQYEKFATYLRNELVSNNLADFHLRKGLDHLHAVRQRFQTITDRF